MNDKTALSVAFDNNEMNTFNTLLDGVLGEYLEGGIESSRILFNEYWSMMRVKDKKAFVAVTVFDSLEFFKDYKN